MVEIDQSEAQRLETLTGHRLGPYLSFNPVNATQIWQWCSAMGDSNPRYTPGDQQVAPPAMMQMWTMRDINDRCAPGSTEAAQYRVFKDMEAMGYPANVAVSYDITFHRYLQPGERVRHYSTVVNISDKKSTALGLGFFVTEKVEYTTDEDRPFAEALISYFQYLPTQSRTQNENSVVPEVTRPTAQNQAQKQERPDFTQLVTETLTIGENLPGRVTPITHRLIVGGAIATQDFTPVHHNVVAAQEASMPDIFMNILTTCGLSARYLSDWAGADSHLKHISFKLMSPNFPGDALTMEGRVTDLSTTDSTIEVSVDFGGKNARGYHVTGSATLDLPNNRAQPVL